jgi:ketosteroid isomerase-like protein
MSSLQLVRDTYDALNRGDIDTVLGTFDAGIGWREAEGNPHQPSGSRHDHFGGGS